jgi:hypothetical protein
MSQRPHDGGNKHLWNAGKLLPEYTALQPRRQALVYSPPRKPKNYVCFVAWISAQIILYGEHITSVGFFLGAAHSCQWGMSHIPKNVSPDSSLHQQSRHCQSLHEIVNFFVVDSFQDGLCPDILLCGTAQSYERSNLSPKSDRSYKANSCNNCVRCMSYFHCLRMETDSVRDAMTHLSSTDSLLPHAFNSKSTLPIRFLSPPQPRSHVLLPTRELSGSNLGPEVDYPHRFFCFSSVPPGQFRDSVLNYATAAALTSDVL